VAPRADLESATRAVVERIAELPRAALAESKRCIAAAMDGSRDGYETELAGSARLLAMAETQRRVQRFLEKGA